jgi:tetratricopeptide (TPR) repeat protein
MTFFERSDDPLGRANATRHLGIAHEKAGRLLEAKRCYDEALALFRGNETADTLDYANAVRYPAVIKNRLGKREEATELWAEAVSRYAAVDIVEGIAEGAAHMTQFAIDAGDLELAREWFEKARVASEKSGDPDTHKFVAEVGAHLENAENA